ncbi:MAG: FlgD immunoglobulin-like domain containing protein [Capsulimonadales bacterium]|nr:FlgD immunoglobulin-like domain containing protein [Capsulimonadales bacterium]
MYNSPGVPVSLPVLVLAVCLLTGVRALGAEPPEAPPAASPRTFSYVLPDDGRTSAGIFDREGRLVRVLWSLRSQTAGKHTETWDGLNEVGEAAPSGPYRFKIVRNPGSYEHVAAIGNLGDAPDIDGHTPAFMGGLTMDRDGNAFTANAWDEAGADFKKWDRKGNSVFDGRFAIRNGNPNGHAYAVASDDRYLYFGTTSWSNERSKERQYVRRFRLSDGKPAPFTAPNAVNGHLAFMEWPSRQVSEQVSGRPRGLRMQPLHAIATVGDLLLVGDALNDRVYRFDRETGAAKGWFPLPYPKTFAPAKDGSLWVGYDLHKLGRIENPLAENPTVRTVRSDIGMIESISIARNGKLFIADSEKGQVRVFSPDGKTALRTYGRKAVPGDVAPDRYFFLRGVAVDADGSFVTIQTEKPVGARIARFKPNGRVLWERFGGETMSGANYGENDPDTLYSFGFHRYALGDRKKGEWTYRGNMFSPPDYHDPHPHGNLRVLRLSGADFVFHPTGDGVQVYRVQGNVLMLAALVGGGSPGPDGKTDPKRLSDKWVWHDTEGDGNPEPSEIRIYPSEQPEPRKWSEYATPGMHVDRRGDFWFAFHGSIWHLPRQGVNERGNPVYDWAKVRNVTGSASLEGPPARINPISVAVGENGLFYVIGPNRRWPPPKNNPFWMGATSLACFDASGRLRWIRRLPEVSVGLEYVPGGGLLIGGGASDIIYHYTSDGLLLGTVKPGAVGANLTTWLDTTGCISANRDPRDRKIDVFVEDDRIGRVLWYRIEDDRIAEISGDLL